MISFNKVGHVRTFVCRSQRSSTVGQPLFFCVLIALHFTLMATANESRDPAAWEADQQRWYLSLVAHCHDVQGVHNVPDMPNVLAALSAWPLTECLYMVGDPEFEGRVEDINHQLWSEDQKGRWFATVQRKKVWLQRELVRIGYGHLPRADEVVSHICGNCGCIRSQHLRIQSRSEDARDRVHHRAHGTGQIRCTKRPPNSPVTAPKPTGKHRRMRSPESE